MQKISADSSLEELKACMDKINQEMERLEGTEPANESSKEHKAWEERCDEMAFASETVMTLLDQKVREGL